MSAGQRRSTGDREGGVRDRLVDAAGSLIAERGASAATSRAISERAGENLGSITYYFGSKDALVSETLIRQARGLLQPVLDELAGDRPPAEKLLAAVRVLTTIVAERRDQLPGYLECLAQSPHDEGLASALRDLSRDLRRELAADMTRQRDDGQIPGWVDPAAMASLIVALATGVVAEVVTDPDVTDPGAIGSQFAALLLAARDQAAPDEGR
jgi:AcrR family transcriptional regulator